MIFFTGMHHPGVAARVPSACVSVNALRRRKGAFAAPAEGWLLDSGAFTEISTHGRYRDTPETYAVEAVKWARLVPGLQAIVAQDFMCEPFILARTGLDVPEHQRLTIERYDTLALALDLLGEATPIMPVLQGFDPSDYVAHLAAYGDRITRGMWVGVGSVCKRQGSPDAIYQVLRAIKEARPDLRLHGFGVKTTALKDPRVRELLHSADSMAWSFAARKQGRDRNSPEEALAFHRRVEALINEGTQAA